MAKQASKLKDGNTWPLVVAYFVESLLPRSVARPRIPEGLRAAGLVCVVNRPQLAAALGCDKDTLYNPSPGLRTQLAMLYDATDAACLKAIDEADQTALKSAYEARHAKHVATDTTANSGKWAKAKSGNGRKSAGTVAPFKPPSPEALFLKRIVQQEMPALDELEPGYVIAAYHRLIFVGDDSSTQIDATLSIATRAAPSTRETRPRSADSRFATLELRCETNAEQPWPVNVDLTFGSSHPEGYELVAGWIEFRFSGDGRAEPEVGKRRRFPGAKKDLALQVSSGAREIQSEWGLRLSPGGDSTRPNLLVEHTAMPFPAALTVRAVLAIENIRDGETLSAAFVLPVKDQN